MKRTDSRLLFIGEFDTEVVHPDLGVIRRGTVSYEYYWLDRWYNVFRFHEPDGSLRNYYCNINLPPQFDGAVLDYVDLDIDVLVWPDNRYEILDTDEFVSNAEAFGYPREVVENGKRTLSELIELIKEENLPR